MGGGDAEIRVVGNPAFYEVIEQGIVKTAPPGNSDGHRVQVGLVPVGEGGADFGFGRMEVRADGAAVQQQARDRPGQEQELTTPDPLGQFPPVAGKAVERFKPIDAAAFTWQPLDIKAEPA